MTTIHSDEVRLAKKIKFCLEKWLVYNASYKVLYWGKCEFVFGVIVLGHQLLMLRAYSCHYAQELFGAYTNATICNARDWTQV